jgi:L-alanine-DL-glutamate epimerase-like enolase superfamily enzyme
MIDVAQARCELWRTVLDAPVGGSGVATFDTLFVTLVDSDGVTGVGFAYVLGGRDALPLGAAEQLLDRFVVSASGIHPIALWQRIAASFNRTGGGPYATALAAIDVAAWDLLAVRAGIPLGVALGGAARRVPVYGSGGFVADGDAAGAAAVAAAYLARGFGTVKARAAGTAADRAVLQAVAGTGAALMVDANEKCTPVTAARLLREAADAGALWLEEPLPAAALSAYRTLARHAPVPLATGEHARSLAEASPFVTEGLCSVLQPDLQALGGLTPCLHVARFAADHGVEVAPHFLPALFVHLAAAAPNVTWLEDFPLLEPLLDGVPAVAADGTLGLPPGPGHGLRPAAWARERYRIAP